MLTAQELYPELVDKDSSYFYGPCDYQPILKSFGQIEIQVDDNDYQGDSRVLYREGNKYGYLQFGWGSCSGCDSLQACDSFEDINKLIGELRDLIKWFNSSQQALEFFETHDWKGDYSWRQDEQQEFIEKAINYLKGACG